jgi:hypothetical protein
MCIIEFLDKTRFNRPEQEVVKSLNRVLRNHNYPELDIIDHRNRKASKGKSDVPDTPYKISGKGFRLLSSDTALYGDQYDSSETDYSLSRCRCMGWFKAENTDTGNVFVVSTSILNFISHNPNFEMELGMALEGCLISRYTVSTFMKRKYNKRKKSDD